MKKKILILSICFIMILGTVTNVSFSRDTAQNNNNIIVSDVTMKEAKNTIEGTKNNKDFSTKKIVKIKESELEGEATFVPKTYKAQAQSNNVSGEGLSLLGAYQGLTYYNQADTRWANELYTSTNNKTQTMKSSGCGPTACAMVVTASKGTILPTTMAKLFVDNGYRTKSDGTAWSAFSFTADYFGFNEYYTTANYNTAMEYLEKGYYVIASCSSGLFTTSGHFIFLTDLSNDTISVYDPYLYDKKFETPSRKPANVVVVGDNAKVSKANFKKYANAKQYFIFSNDKGSGNIKDNIPDNSTNANKTATKYVHVSEDSSLNVRSGPGTNYKIVTSLKNNEKVTVYETKDGWSRIGTNKWVSSSYLYTDKNTNVSMKNPVSNNNSTVKKPVKAKTYTRYIHVSTKLNVRKGPGTKYKKVSTLKNNAKVTVYETKSGWSRIGTNKWITSSYLYTYKSTVGKTKKIKASTLYSKKNLSGKKYKYKKNTKVKILKNISAKIDYVKVVGTNKKLYIKVSNYK
ncbi:MAG: SH3 domain-containing protein [Clostridia bacterium]|nr:SH3 domain-containing protein [Clostridia bacterium]